jgi:hypothetical protein
MLLSFACRNGFASRYKERSVFATRRARVERWGMRLGRSGFSAFRARHFCGDPSRNGTDLVHRCQRTLGLLMLMSRRKTRAIEVVRDVQLYAEYLGLTCDD